VLDSSIVQPIKDVLLVGRNHCGWIAHSFASNICSQTPVVRKNPVRSLVPQNVLDGSITQAEKNVLLFSRDHSGGITHGCVGNVGPQTPVVRKYLVRSLVPQNVLDGSITEAEKNVLLFSRDHGGRIPGRSLCNASPGAPVIGKDMVGGRIPENMLDCSIVQSVKDMLLGSAYRPLNPRSQCSKRVGEDCGIKGRIPVVQRTNHVRPAGKTRDSMSFVEVDDQRTAGIAS
jgi:hypothetical protein